MAAGGMPVAVGLFGLQTIAIRVAAVTSRAMAARSCSALSFNGTVAARAPDIAASCGYIENDGQAYTSSAPGSSIASAAARSSSHEPLPTAIRPVGPPVRSEIL